MYKVTLKLRNETDRDVTCIVPKGQIFENASAMYPGQNLAAARDYHLIIPSKSRITFEIEALCTNQFMRPPSGALGRTTIFRIAQAFDSQEDLWNVMSFGNSR